MFAQADMRTRALLFHFFLCSLPVCQVANSQAKDPPTNLEVARQAFVQVVDKVSPSVVVIDVLQKPAPPSEDEDSLESLPKQFRKYFRQFEEGPDEKSLGQGSGIIIREDGFILTNSHVVEDTEKIEVRLRDGRTFKAAVRGLDPQSDLAVIKIEAKGLPVAPLGDSTKTRVGEFAIAIGAPFSLDYSVTFGHVSAKGRSNVIIDESAEMMDQDFIQTDANINPGNSGGPLVNIEGEVIGINTLIRGLHTGIGFAIPSSLARDISEKLITDGKYARTWLGISIKALQNNPDFHQNLKGAQEGIVVEIVFSDGPASKSGLKARDVITAVNGHKINTTQQLRGEIRGKKPGEQVVLDVIRSGKPMQVKVKPAEWDATSSKPVNKKKKSLPKTDEGKKGEETSAAPQK